MNTDMWAMVRWRRTVGQFSFCLLTLIALGNLVGPSGPRLVPTLQAADEGDTTVYVTRTGKKYHRSSCGSLSRSKIAMRLADAAVKYGPCLNCAPPTLDAAPKARGLVSPPATTGGRCAATTKKGTQCSRTVTKGAYCWQHGR